LGGVLAPARPNTRHASERVPDRVLPSLALCRAALPWLRARLAIGHGPGLHPVRAARPDRAASGHVRPAWARDLVLQPAVSAARVRRPRGLRALHAAESAGRMRARAASGHGVVALPVLDVRPEPAHTAELASQLLLGETVALGSRSRDGGWVRVRNAADGYAGWVRTWGVVEASRARVANWRRRARGRIGLPMGLVLSAPRSGAAVSPVFFGGRLIAARPRLGWVAVELPDGRRGFLPVNALAAP